MPAALLWADRLVLVLGVVMEIAPMRRRPWQELALGGGALPFGTDAHPPYIQNFLAQLTKHFFAALMSRRRCHTGWPVHCDPDLQPASDLGARLWFH